MSYERITKRVYRCKCDVCGHPWDAEKLPERCQARAQRDIPAGQEGEHEMTQATQIVHWPGKDVPACDAHAAQLRGVASIIGSPVSCTPVDQPELQCSNCINQRHVEPEQ